MANIVVCCGGFRWRASKKNINKIDLKSIKTKAKQHKELKEHPSNHLHRTSGNTWSLEIDAPQMNDLNNLYAEQV